MASEFNNTKHPQMIKTFMKNGNVLEILMYWRIKQSLIYKPAKKKKPEVRSDETENNVEQCVT
jgi:hypothetical protein